MLLIVANFDSFGFLVASLVDIASFYAHVQAVEETIVSNISYTNTLNVQAADQFILDNWIDDCGEVISGNFGVKQRTDGERRTERVEGADEILTANARPK